MKRLIPDDSQRILICRLSSFGDAVHGLPVLCALRERYPRAHIGWVIEDWIAGLLDGHDSLDELITVRRNLTSPWPKRTLPIRLPALWRLRNRLRTSRYTVSIDLQGRTKSAIAAWLSGASLRIGFSGIDGRELSSRLNNYLVQPHCHHVVDRYLELLTPLGISESEKAFRVPVLPGAAEKVKTLLGSLGVDDGFVVMNPGTGNESRRWATERYGSLAEQVVKSLGVPVLIAWAGNDEWEMGRHVRESSNGCAVLLPATSIAELAALVSCSRCFIGSDSGPLHLAAALGMPCVGLYGPTDPRRTGPYGSGHIVANEKSMENITFEDALTAVHKIIRRNLKHDRQSVSDHRFSSGETI